MSKKKEKWIWIFGAAVLVIVLVLLTTGEIRVTSGEKYITIKASYWKDKGIAYEDIQDITYRETLGTGKRVGGFGSFKLAEGGFRNDEFGNYTLYAYESCNTYIVLNTAEEIVVINQKTDQQTKKLYEELAEKCL